MKYKFLTISLAIIISVALGLLQLAEVAFMLLAMLFLYWIIVTLIRKSHSGKFDPILVFGWTIAVGFVLLIGYLLYRISYGYW